MDKTEKIVNYMENGKNRSETRAARGTVLKHENGSADVIRTLH